MARKFGKKNIVKVDMFSYNIGLYGSGGIGKSRLIVDLCNNKLGEDGYILLNIGREKGVDAIQGAIYEDVPDWLTFDQIITDIENNKDTDYKDLRVIVYDTIDELAILAEKEVIKRHNLKYPQKRTDSINAAFGGFGTGQRMISELILDSIDRLKRVGVNVIIIGHVKRKTKFDLEGNEYDVITAKTTNKLFDDIQTKLDVLGIGIVKVDTLTKKKERKIIFRADNFIVDSKSRFADITPEIEFSPTAFINAIEDAIKKAYNSKPIDVTFDEAKKQQEKEFKEKVEKNIKMIKEKKQTEDKLKKYGGLDAIVNKIKETYLNEKTDAKVKETIINIMKENKLNKFDLLEDNTEVALKIYETIK